MAYIPGGHHRYSDVVRGKWRDVDVAAFWLDRFEVTVAEYRSCVEAGACKQPRSSSSGYTDPARHPLVCTWEMQDGGSLPINCVDHDDAGAYCAWVEKRVPLGFEWTWAAQGRELRRKYPWGDSVGSCDDAIIDQNTDDDERGCGRERPWPVGSRSRDVTRDGVMDMAGNVGEIATFPFPEDIGPPHQYGMSEGCGSAWTVHLKAYGMAACSPIVSSSYSDNAGFRCAKTPSAVPPCTVVK